MQEIARQLDCSVNKVQYWMLQHGLKARSISEAIYQKNNPTGDPFSFQMPDTMEQAQLFGMGLGLYWGEGTKANKHSVRLGNTDPKLLKMFIRFLVEIFHIKREDLRFSLQIFTDIQEQEALKFWIKRLNARRQQFCKVTKTISGSIGTYRQKSTYGVVTVYYHNVKLRNVIVGLLPK